ncbi:MAG: pilus assembly protein, partial [Geminicoccaceae bacterium]|nr:pilus assembly protein [Geminicoccaceae bacterium]
MTRSFRSRILGATSLNRENAAAGSLTAKDGTLTGDETAATAVEFALVVPVLLLLLGASVEIANIMAIERKVSLTTQALVDMAARYPVISSSELSELQAAAALMMRPYSSFESVVASVVIDDTGTPLTQTTDGTWQLDVSGAAPFSQSEMAQAAGGLGIIDDTVVLARVAVDYEPVFTHLFPLHPTISDVMVMRPRLVAALDGVTPTLPPAPPPPP